MKTFKPLIYISKELITVSAEARYRSVFPLLVTIYINKFIYIIKECQNPLAIDSAADPPRR